jgi:hypothetical protein
MIKEIKEMAFLSESFDGGSHKVYLQNFAFVEKNRIF